MKDYQIITLESAAFKHLIHRIENMEQMMLAIVKSLGQGKRDEQPNPQREFVTREAAKLEFGISLTTIDKKVKKFGVGRLNAGGKKLLNRLEFIKALQQPDPFSKIIVKRQDSRKVG